MKTLGMPLVFLWVLLTVNSGLNGQLSSAAKSPESSSDNAQQQPVKPDSPPDVKQLIGELPPCSFLRQQLIRGIYENGPWQPYMEAMRREGVRKAVIVVNARWNGKKITDPVLQNHVYFAKYDAPSSQIVDSEQLDNMKKSGLETLLDDFVLAQSQTLPLYNGPDGGPLKKGAPIYSYVRLFDNPRIAAIPNRFMRSKPQRSELGVAVSSGDAIHLKRLTQEHKMSTKELNSLLASAVMNSFDNSQIINALIGAGADVNAPVEDGTPLVIIAIGQPCNLKALLENGARADVRDRWHRSALDNARAGHQYESEKMIREALAQP